MSIESLPTTAKLVGINLLIPIISKIPTKLLY